jgi:hypothetical protein
MTLEELKPGTPEADQFAINFLKTLYEIAAMDKGAKLTSLTIIDKNDPTKSVKVV